MRNIFFFLLFITNLSFGTELPKLNCNSEVEELLKNWGSQNTWNTRGDQTYYSPTEIFGEWVIVLPENGGVTLTKANEASEIRVNFSRDCKRSLKIVDLPMVPFTKGDEYLKDVIKDKKGIIYLWSPQMPLSIRGISSVKAAAKSLGLTAIILMDNSNKIPQYMNKNIEVNSFELRMRNAYLHFPSIMAFENGKLKNTVKYGYENKDEYKKDLKKMFNL